MYNFLAGQELTGSMLALLLIASAWTLVWKGIGLWHAGRGSQKGWFVIMMIFNTLGLLPIIYLIWFRRTYVVKELVKKKPKKK